MLLRLPSRCAASESVLWSYVADGLWDRQKGYGEWEWEDVGSKARQEHRNSLVAQLWQGIQQPELQKKADESSYSIWNLKAIEKVKR